MNMDTSTEMPDWLTEDFIKYCLKNSYNNSDGIEIKHLEITYAVPKGNNYTSDILRVKVDYSKSEFSDEEMKSSSMIIKSPILEGDMYNAILEVGILQKEFKIYYEFLPKLSNLYYENNDKYVTPRCLPTKKELVIVMEDLNVEGYKLVDRCEQLDFDHAVVVMENLSKFHAASAKLLEDEPELVDKYGENLLINKEKHKNDKIFKTADCFMGKTQLKYLGREVENWPESKKYADKIYRIMDNVWEIQYKLFEIDDNDFNVLIHGDLWSSNMLFKYSVDNGKPEHVKFVDLQVMHYGLPATDLLYFIYSSLKLDILVTKLDKLLEIYYENLNANLEKYGCKKRLSEDEFKRKMDEKEIYGFLCSCRILLFALADKDNVIDFKNEVDEDDEEEGNILKKYLKSRKFRCVFPKILDYFSKKPWFQKI